MTDKRLKEIKDSIDLQLEVAKVIGLSHILKEEKELYDYVEELKKQLEECKKQINSGLYSTCLPYKTGYDKAIEDYKNQQQEFIKYLEESQFVPSITGEDYEEDYTITEVLQKYKEIIGVKNENNKR